MYMLPGYSISEVMLFNVSTKFSLVSAPSGVLPGGRGFSIPRLWPTFSARTITDLTEAVRTLLRTDVEEVRD
jgi:hypothetical protein